MKKHIYITLAFILLAVEGIAQTKADYSFKITNPSSGNVVTLNFNNVTDAIFGESQLEFMRGSTSTAFPYKSGTTSFLEFCIERTESHDFDDYGFCQYEEDITSGGEKYDHGFMQPVEVTYANCAQYGGESAIGSYAISNLGQMYWLAKNVNNGAISEAKRFFLVNDIDMSLPRDPVSGTVLPHVAELNWAPIGSEVHPFIGVFDGNGYSLTNFTYSIPTGYAYYGLFGSVGNGAVIKNFTADGTITGSNIYTSGTRIIGLISNTINESKVDIEDVHSKVSFNLSQSTDCKSEVTVGGVLGNGRVGDVLINRCRYSGTITSTLNKNVKNIGGIIGIQRNYNKVRNCLFDGVLDIVKCGNTDQYIGGISAVLHQISGTEPLKVTYIENCLSVGTIVTTTGKGGAVNSAISHINVKANLKFSNNYYKVNGISVYEGDNNKTDYWKTKPIQVDNITSVYVEKLDAYNWTWDSEHSICVPSNKHDFVNGVCEHTNGYVHYEKPTLLNKYYQIANYGNLKWFQEYVNVSMVANANALLLTDIDMEGKKYGAFPGIGVMTSNQTTKYSGTFDGGGHTIKNVYLNMTESTNRRGFFNYSCGNIKNFTITGTLEVNTTSAMHAPVVGEAAGGLVEDVICKVDITCPKACSMVGGIAGCISSNATINRCRYSGNATLEKAFVTSFGGICGEIRGGSVTNCLFDGAIESQNPGNTSIVGGIVGRCKDNGDLTLTGALSHGTIVFNGTSRKCGIVIGYIQSGRKAVMDNVYYTTTGITPSGVPAVGSDTPASALTGSSEDVTGAQSLYDGTVQWYLGQANWAQDSYVPGNYPYPQSGGVHQHKYDSYGFCMASDKTPMEAPLVDGWYEISNAGNLFWFAQQINSSTSGFALNSKAKLVNDIKMGGENYIYPGIGSDLRQFKGTFDGQGYSISEFYMSSSANKLGLFGSIQGATISDFSISGDIICKKDDQQFAASVVAYTDGTGAQSKISDVSSNVNIKCEHLGTAIAGIVGRSFGTINRCRYYGKINAGQAYNGIGGIVGNAQPTTISNCLFDGEIDCKSTSTGEPYGVSVGGILAASENNTSHKVTIKNSLSHGKVTLAGDPNNHCGVFVGYKNHGNLTVSGSYYTTDGCTLAGQPFTAVSSTDNASAVSAGASLPGTKTWNEICASLGTENWNIRDEEYPVPYNLSICHIYNEADFIRGVNYVNETGNVLHFFLDRSIELTSSGNAVLPIGKSTTKYFNGIFDGKGNTISGINIQGSGDIAGFFGYVGGTNNYIQNLNLKGEIKGPNNTSSSLWMGVVASVYEQKNKDTQLNVDNVFSWLNMTACDNYSGSCNVGGIVGGFSNNGNDGGSRLKVSINRCAYFGNIDVKKGYNRIAGIIAGADCGTTVSNCLMKGSITAKRYDKSNSVDFFIGGIVGVSRSSFGGINNCLMDGTLNQAMKISTSGYIIGGSSLKTNSQLYADNYLGPDARILVDDASVENNKRKSGYGLTITPYNTITVSNDTKFKPLENGMICANLNKGKNAGTPVWGQILGNVDGDDKYPTPRNTYYVTVDNNNDYHAKKCVLSTGTGELYLPDFTSNGSKNKYIVTESLSISAKLTDNAWLPMFVPVRMSYDNWKDKLEIAKIMNFHHYVKEADGELPEREYVVLEVQMVTKGTLKENHPYLVRAKNNKGANVLSLTMDVNNTTSPDHRSVYEKNDEQTLTCATTEREYVFKGNYGAGFTFPDNSVSGDVYYVLGHQDNKDMLKVTSDLLTKYGASGLVPTCTWYMTQKDRESLGGTSLCAPSRIYVRFSGEDYDDIFNEETTGIDDVIEAQSVRPVSYTTADGVVHSSPQVGKVNIVRMSDGTVRKVKVFSPTINF